MPWNVHLPPANWYTLESPDLEAVVREVADQKVIAIDTETTGLNVVSDFPLFWSLCWGERRICMRASALSAFRHVFADPDKTWVFANAKYDVHMLANVGIEIKGRLADTAVMHALLYEESSHALKDMAQEILGWRWSDFFDTFKRVNILREDGVKTKESIQELLERTARDDLPSLVEYASNDAYGTMRLFEKLKKELEASPTFSLYPDDYATMADVFFKTEVPFTKVLYGCERNGIKINAGYLDSLGGPVQESLNKIEREIVRIVGRPLNPNSTVQLRKYFLEERGLKALKLSKGGKTGVKNPSVDVSFIEHYADEDPVAKLLLEYRDLSKLLNTYIKGLQRAADQEGRIHTRFNQDIARTGRLSSANPNLQNIPRPDTDRFKLRGAFIPREGYELIVADYEALEMRLLAAAALEPGMIDIFMKGLDIHMGNAAMVFGKKFDITYEDIKEAKKIGGLVTAGQLPGDALTPKMKNCLFARQAIKDICFGMNYGMKEKKLARRLGCSVEDAIDMIDAYMSRYPAVKQFYGEAIEETRKTGYSHTVIGRRRYLPEILSSREFERWTAERQAVNTQIQGSAADVCRFAMLNCYYAGLDSRLGCKMLLQVHDELVFECPKETVAEAKEIIRDCMEHPFQTDLAVPLTISMGSGKSWYEAK